MFYKKIFYYFKEALSETLIDEITPISIEINKLLNDKSHLDNVLEEGSKKASEIASKKVKKIHEILGF